MRIYVEKPEIAGTRRVVIRPSSNNTSSDPVAAVGQTTADKERIQQCAEHVLGISLTQQQADKAAAATSTNTNVINS